MQYASSRCAIRLHTSPVLPTEGFVHGFPERGRRRVDRGRARRSTSASAGATTRRTSRRIAAGSRRHAGYAPEQLAGHAPRPRHRGVDGRRAAARPRRVRRPRVAIAPGPVLGAFAADCIPILFADPEARVIGAAHAGWRGTVGGVAANVIARMVELGARADRIRGRARPLDRPVLLRGRPRGRRPVPRRARRRAGPRRRRPAQGPPRSPRRATASCSSAPACAPTSIDDRPPCTRCEADRFFSYRRDGKDGGVHMALHRDALGCGRLRTPLASLPPPVLGSQGGTLLPYGPRWRLASRVPRSASRHCPRETAISGSSTRIRAR